MLWEVYAARYGTQTRTAGMNMIGTSDPHDPPMTLGFFVWLLRSGDRQIVVDTGFRGERTLTRGRRILRSVRAALTQLGYDPEHVRDVVITHLHYDHAGNLDLFPSAVFHLQEREMAFATEKRSDGYSHRGRRLVGRDCVSHAPLVACTAKPIPHEGLKLVRRWSSGEAEGSLRIQETLDGNLRGEAFKSACRTPGSKPFIDRMPRLRRPTMK